MSEKTTVIRRKAEIFQKRADNATDPISKQHYGEIAAHYRRLLAEHLDVRNAESVH